MSTGLVAASVRADLVAVALDAAVWAAWSVAVGTVVGRLPESRFDHDTWLTRPRALEGGTRLYERLAIRRWKDHLPEAGTWVGGRSKRHLPGTDPTALRRFAAATRRAELVHWLVPLVWPVFLVWNRGLLLAAMTAYALVANVPCIAIQRFNRARITRALARIPTLGAPR
jgi:glycosyl-4,4'-diaponeurosporenoate acyltransferase